MTRASQRLRVVVTGMIATFPLGGVYWDYVQYVLGLLRLGHEVLYLEDSGRWCYDPLRQTFCADGSNNAAFVQNAFSQLPDEAQMRWHFRDALENEYGSQWQYVRDYCRSADLFIHLSASCTMRQEYYSAERVAFVDTDPMYTQASVPGYLDGSLDAVAKSRVDMLREHDVFFTFAENIAGRDCLIPSDLFNWMPTRQPIVLDHFREHRIPVAERRRVLTTVASWEPREEGPRVRGIQYFGKSKEFIRYLHLPRRVPVPLEVALSGPAPHDVLRSAGWRLRDGFDVSASADGYRQYLASSLGEFSVAKNAYVESRSGWFSCRSGCYLALGVPVVVQDTGFTGTLPSGLGIVAFHDCSTAMAAIESVCERPEEHAKAARDVAEQYFDSDAILTQFIEMAMS